MPSQAIQLHFPTGGVVRRTSYQDGNSQYTTPDALNVWPDDAILQRERGGSRAGTELVGTAGVSAVQMIADRAYASGGSYVNEAVVASGGTLYSWDGSSFSSVGSGLGSLKNLTFADIESNLYIATGGTPKVYDGSSVTDLTATEGTIPSSCNLASNFNRRLVLSDGVNTYFSRQGDPTDWDYSPVDENDTQAAVALNLTDQGRLGEPVRALIFHHGCLLFGCNSSMWSLRGDPLWGGEVVQISNRIGVHSAMSWCYDPDGWLYFLSQDGLYFMEPGCGSAPRSISRERIPEELINVSRSTNTVSMGYDLRYRGVVLCIKKDSGTSTHWFIDTRMVKGGDSATGSMSFWPMQFSGYNPTACWSLRDAVGTGSDSTMWMGTSDGKVIRFNKTAVNDNGTTFNSYIDYGPFPLAAPGRDGILTKVQVMLSANSEEVVGSVRVGKNAEAAYNSSTAESKTFTASGLNQTWHCRRRGPSSVLRFSSNSDKDAPWSLEGVTAFRQDAGELRP